MTVKPVSKDIIRGIKKRALYLYLFGRITYSDGFGHVRQLGFCGVHEVDQPKWMSCPTNNWAD
jgi:hypothetical protein